MIPCPAVVEKCCESTYQKYLYSTLTKALYTRLKNIDLNISLFNNWYLSSTNHFGFTISKETKKELLTQYSEIYRTFNQITKEGFLEAEIEEAKNDIIETLLRADYSETNTSSYIMENFTDHIISGDIYLCDDKEREVVVEKIKTISNNNLIPILEGFLENAKKTTLIAFNNGLKDETITSKEIKKAIKEGLKMPFLTVTHKEKAVEDEEIKVDIPELNILPQFDSTLISKIVDYKNLGIKEITLSNGIKLILRKTTDNTKNINLSILSKGGSFWLSKEEFPKYDDVAGYMELGGIEGIDEDTLSEFIMQKGMSSCLIFDNNWNGFMGSCNIESSLQLFNYTAKKLYNPQLCYESFEELIEEDIESFGKKSFLDKMIEQDPARQVRLRMDQLLGNISPSHGDFKSIDDIKKMDLDNVAKLYHSLYCNTTDKNILIAGNFDMDKIIKEAVSIFGSLPVQEMDSKHKLAEFSLPSESYSEQFDNSNETQTIIDYTFYGNYEPNLKNSLTLKIMRDILQNEVLDILRAQESIVYSPYVDLFYNGLPYGVYYVDFYLSVNTENGTKAINLIDNIIKKYQKEIISEEVLNNIKLSFQIAKRDALSDDNISAWSKQMETLIRNNESFADYNKYEEILKSITAEEIRESFNKYFNFEHILKLHQGELK